MPGKTTPLGFEEIEKTKAEEVVQMLCAGVGVLAVAKATGVSRQLVAQVKKQIPADQIQNEQRKIEARVGHSLSLYVVEALESMRKQAKYVGTEKFLKNQNAADIAKLHETMSAHMIKLLEAAGRARRGRVVGEEEPKQPEKQIGNGQTGDKK